MKSRETEDIVFGLNRQTDERSMALFLGRFSRKQLTEVLIPRLSDSELSMLLDQLSLLLKKHLTDPEYHKLFLNDR